MKNQLECNFDLKLKIDLLKEEKEMFINTIHLLSKKDSIKMLLIKEEYL